MKRPIHRLAASLLSAATLGLLALPALAGPFAYVANKDSDDVSIVDLASAQELERLAVVNNPKGVATNFTQTKLVVANDQYLSVFDMNDLNAPRVDIDLQLGGASDVIADPASDRVWVSHKDWGELTEVNLQTLSWVARIPTGLSNVRHMAISNSTDQVYGVSQLGSIFQMNSSGIPQARKIAHEISPIPSDIQVEWADRVLVGSKANAEVLAFPEPAAGAMAAPTVVTSGYTPGGVGISPIESDLPHDTVVTRPNADVVDFGTAQLNLLAGSEPKWVRLSDSVAYTVIALEHDQYGVSGPNDGSLLILTGAGIDYAPVGDDPRDLEIEPPIGPRLFSPTGNLDFNTNWNSGSTRSLTLRSTGDQDLSVSQLSFSGPDAGDFAVIGQNCSGLEFQDECRVTIHFTPTPKTCRPSPWLRYSICAPRYAARLNIQSNGGMAEVSLRGGLFVFNPALEARPSLVPKFTIR